LGFVSDFKTELALAEYVVRFLQRHNNQLTLQNPDALVLITFINIVRNINFDKCPIFVQLFEANPDQHQNLKNFIDNLDVPAMYLEIV